MDSFKLFFDSGRTDIYALEYDSIKSEADRLQVEEERLEAACDVLLGIKALTKKYQNTIHDFKNTLARIRSGYKRKDEEKYSFFDGLYMTADHMHTIYQQFGEALAAIIPAEPLDPRHINITDTVTKLECTIRVFTESFKDIYISFVEGYANTAEIFKSYTDIDTFNIFDSYFKSPNESLHSLFELLRKLCENTSGDAKKMADTALAKVRDCTNRIKLAFEYCYRVSKLLYFRKSVEEYNIEDKVVMDGTRTVVLPNKTGSFTVNGEFYPSKFETGKVISAKFHVFNNGLLLCSTKTKETGLVDFKDVEITAGKDMLKIVHESRKWVVTLSGMGKSFEEFRDTVIKCMVTSKEMRVFGNDLETLAKKSKSSRPYIPRIIDVAIQYLLRPESIKTEGILRHAGNKKDIDRFVQATDNGYDVHFNDPLMASVFLKRWVQSIPGSLLMMSKKEEWKAAGSNPEQVVNVFRSLPEANQAVFRALIELSVRIMEEESSNRMNKDAVITCLQMVVLEDYYVSSKVLSVFLDNPNLVRAGTAVVTPPISRVTPNRHGKLTPPMIAKHQKNNSDPSLMFTGGGIGVGVGNNNNSSVSSGSSASSSSSNSNGNNNGHSITIVGYRSRDTMSSFVPPSPPFSITAKQQINQAQGSNLTTPLKMQSAANLKFQSSLSPKFSSTPSLGMSTNPLNLNFPPPTPPSTPPPPMSFSMAPPQEPPPPPPPPSSSSQLQQIRPSEFK